MSTKFLDFQAIKDGFSFNDAVRYLDLKMTQSGDQLRGACPACKSGGPRGLVITPNKGFYCFGAKKGGDQIALIAHIRGIGMREAGELVQAVSLPAGTSTSVPKRREPAQQAPATKGLAPFTYLQAENEAVQALGVSAETAELFESGFANKGVLKGRYAVPIKSLDGMLLAYVGIAVQEEQSPRLLFHSFDPAAAIWNIERVAEGAELSVCRDPLDAILAVENGLPADQVASFLAPISAQALEALASLMDSQQIEAVEMF